jgi:hypothetical protein
MARLGGARLARLFSLGRASGLRALRGMGVLVRSTGVRATTLATRGGAARARRRARSAGLLVALLRPGDRAARVCTHDTAVVAGRAAPERGLPAHPAHSRALVPGRAALRTERRRLPHRRDVRRLRALRPRRRRVLEGDRAPRRSGRRPRGQERLRHPRARDRARAPVPGRPQESRRAHACSCPPMGRVEIPCSWPRWVIASSSPTSRTTASPRRGSWRRPAA